MKEGTRKVFFTSFVAVAGGLTLIVGGIAIWASAQFLLLAFGAVLVGVLLRATGGLLERLGLPHKASVILVFFALLGVVGGLGHLAWPSLVEQTEELGNQVPKALELVKDKIKERPLLARIWGDPMQRFMRPEFLAKTLGVFSTLFGALAGFVFAMILGLYFALEPGLYTGGIARLANPDHRRWFKRVLGKVDETLHWWLVAKIAEMAVIFGMTWAGLAWLEVPLAFMLSIIAALLEFIPNIGPISSVVPAILVVMTEEGGGGRVGQVILLYVGIQAVQSYVISPMIERRMVSIPPAMLISAQAVMGIWAGGLGVLFAAPLAACAMVVINEIYVEPMEDRAKD